MIRWPVSARLTVLAVAGALAAAAGLAGALATGPTANATHVPGTAAAMTAPRWRIQARPPVPAHTSDQAFGDVSCSSSSVCMALAITDLPHGNYGTFAEIWNGSRWTARKVPHGNNPSYEPYNVTCRSAHWCMAVGSIPIGSPSSDNSAPVSYRWDGNIWKQVKPPVPAGATNSDLAEVACSGTRACTAIGAFSKGNGGPNLLVERWNGSRWSIQPVSQPAGGGAQPDAVACPTASACRVLGDDNRGLFSEIWTGSSWVLRAVPKPTGSSPGLNDVSCTAADFCEAVGSYQKGGGVFRSLAEVWNGSRWRLQVLPAVPDATSGGGLNAVSCVSASDCEAAGDAHTKAGNDLGFLEKWNGTHWSLQEKVLPAGDMFAPLLGISCTSGPVCEAVGYSGKEYHHSHLLAMRYSS